ncbi:hypothetical protein RSAG8_09445, partial [Rhizoctonia solani AG-8 WAC10335]
MPAKRTNKATKMPSQASLQAAIAERDRTVADQERPQIDLLKAQSAAPANEPGAGSSSANEESDEELDRSVGASAGLPVRTTRSQATTANAIGGTSALASATQVVAQVPAPSAPPVTAAPAPAPALAQPIQAPSPAPVPVPVPRPASVQAQVPVPAAAPAPAQPIQATGNGKYY